MPNISREEFDKLWTGAENVQNSSPKMSREEFDVLWNENKSTSGQTTTKKQTKSAQKEKESLQSEQRWDTRYRELDPSKKRGTSQKVGEIAKKREEKEDAERQKRLEKLEIGETVGYDDVKQMGKAQGETFKEKNTRNLPAPAKLDRFIDADYKLSDSEQKEAKEIIDNYYKKEYRRATKDNPLTSNEEEKFQKIVTLENKISNGSAFMSGITGAFQGIADMIGRGAENIGKSIGADLGESITDTVRQQQEQINKQNPVASGAGRLAGEFAKYGFTGQALNTFTALPALRTAAATKAANIPVLNKVAAPAANILADTGVDLVADVLPRAGEDIASGKSAEETMKNALKNTAVNVGFNALGEAAIPVLGKAVNSVAGKIGKRAKNANQAIPALENPQTIENTADAIRQSETGAKEATEVLPNGPAKVKSISDFGTSISNSQADEIINNPTLRQEFEQLTGETLTGTKSEMRKKVLNVMNQQSSAPENLTPPRQSDEELTAMMREELRRAGGDLENEAYPVADAIIPMPTSKNEPEFTSTRRISDSQKEYNGFFGKNQNNADFDSMDAANAERIKAERQTARLNELSGNIANVKNDLNSFVDSMQVPDAAQSQVNTIRTEMNTLLDEMAVGGNTSAAYDGFIDKAMELDKIFRRSKAFTQTTDEYSQQAFSQAKEYIKANGGKIYISPDTAKEFPDGVFGLNKYGKDIQFTTDPKQGVSLDKVMDELESLTDFRSTGNDKDDMVAFVDFLTKNKGSRIIQTPYDRLAMNQLVEEAGKPFKQSMDMANLTPDGKQMRVSKYRTNTMENSGIYTKTEMAEHFPEEEYRYVKKTEKESLAEADARLKMNYDGWKKHLMEKESLTGTDIDTLYKIQQDLSKKARETNDNELWKESLAITRKMQEQLTKGGQLVQSVVKQTRDTPEGILIQAENSISEMARKRYGEDFVENVNNIAADIEKIASKSDSYKTMAEAVDDSFKGKKGGWKVRGKKEVKKELAEYKAIDDVEKIIDSGKSYDEMAKELAEYLKTADGKAIDSMKQVISTGKNKYKVIENMLSPEESFKHGEEAYEKMAKELAEYFKTSEGKAAIEEMKSLLNTAKNEKVVSAKEIIYSMNGMPHLSDEAQMQILKIADGLQGKDLKSREARDGIEKINEILSRERKLTKWQKLVEFSHILMLFHTRTNIRNTASNLALMPINRLSNKVAALGEAAYHLVNRDFEKTQTLFKGKEARKIAKEAWERYKNTIESSVSGKYANSAENLFDADQVFLRNPNNFKGRVKKKFGLDPERNSISQIPVLGKIPGLAKRGLNWSANKLGANDAFRGLSSRKTYLENLRQLTYGFLEAGDTPFVKAAFTDRLGRYIKAQGIKSIDELPQEAIDIAASEALKATFKDDNKFTEAFKTLHSIPVAGEIVSPFTKTPANILARLVDYSPAGIILSAVNGKKKIYSAHDVIDGISKGLTGSSLMALGVYMAQKGILTGALSEDPDMAAFQKQQGILPYAISTKGISDFIYDHTGKEVDLGDNFYTIDWMQPSATNLVIGANISDALDAGDGINLIDLGIKSTVEMIDTLLETSTLKNLSDLFDTQYGDTTGERVLQTLGEFPQRFVPAAVGATARTLDPVQRDTYESSFLKTQINIAKSKIPGLSKELPVAYDTWGNPKMRSGYGAQAAFTQFVNPGQLGVSAKTPLDDEISRLYEATGEKGVFPQVAKRKVGDKELTAEEHSEYQKEMGQMSYKLAETIMGSSGYEKMSDADKAENLSLAYGVSKAITEKKLFGSDVATKYQKYVDLYESHGEKGVSDYMALNSLSKSDESNRTESGDEKSFSSSGAKKQVEYVNAVGGLTNKEKGDYIYNAGVSDAEKAFYDKYGGEDLYQLYEFKANADADGNGSYSTSEILKEIEKSSLSDYDKSKYFVQMFGESNLDGKGVSAARSKYGDEGVYNYYKWKDEADTDGKNLSQKEIIPYLQKQNISDQERRDYFQYYFPASKKNPF